MSSGRSGAWGRKAGRTILWTLVERHELSVADVARLARVSPHAATSWLRPLRNRAHRPIPDTALELLCIKLGEPSPFVED